MKKLWEELDDDGSGVISLRELDEKSHRAIEAFYDLLETRCGQLP